MDVGFDNHRLMPNGRTSAGFTMEDYVIAVISRNFNRVPRSVRVRVVAVILAAIAFLPGIASATPSTTYWAPSTASCQAKFVPHITYDTYFWKGTPPPGAGAPTYPIDSGLTMGILPSSKVQAEVGYDLLLPSSNPMLFFLNAKLCTPESSMFNGSPGISFGIYNLGFKKGVTDYNPVHLMFQKAFPGGSGYVAAGLYHGMSDTLFTNSDGKIVKNGAMIGVFSPDIPVGIKGLKKLNLTADIQTGKNVLGGGGFGLYLYFTDTIDLLVGPVWFTDSKLQPGGSKYLWTMQVDIDIPLGK